MVIIRIMIDKVKKEGGRRERLGFDTLHRFVSIVNILIFNPRYIGIF